MKLKQTALALAIGAMAASAQAALWSGNFQTSNGSNFHDGVQPMGSALPMYDFSPAAFFCDTPGGCAGGTVPYGAQINPGTLGNVALGDYVMTYFQSIVTDELPGLRTPDTPGNYEITMAALFREQVVGGHFIFDPPNPNPTGATATLKVLSGTFGLYYGDNTTGTFANVSAGTGFTDGIEILRGFIQDGATSYTVYPIGSALGGTGIDGKVSYAKIGKDDPPNPFPPPPSLPDEVGFMPNAPTGIVATTTIQYGKWAPNLKHQTDNFFDNANGWTPKPVDRTLTVRADGNVDLLVPEPTTLALLGLGLAGLGLSLRRRAA